MSGSDLDALLDDFRGRIEAGLDHALRPRPGLPERLVEAMRYATLGGGKRLRPTMCMLVTRTLGRDPDRALAPAVALEMIHAYSLVHDDLPCMDDSPERRGKPATHIQYGEALGVLVGDALLTEAFGVIAGAATLPDPVRSRCVGTLVRAAGAGGMVGGQVQDVEADVAAISLDAVETLHSTKTGALFECAAEMGAVVASADDWQVQALWAYGSSLGSLFQVTDDLLDWEEDEQGEDAHGSNIVSKIGPMAAHERTQRLYDQAVEALKDIRDTEALEALAARVLRRRA